MSVKQVTRVETPPSDNGDLEATFHRLAEVWSEETGHLSFVANMVAHPAYQQIIALGPSVVPLILRELQREPDYCFAALRALTSEDPTQPGTDFDGATQAWLRWGQERGQCPN
jgi:hypothetical protein